MRSEAAVRFSVAPEETALRLDALLVRRGVAPSAAAARRLIEQDLVRVAGVWARKGARAPVGALVEVAAPSSAVGAPDGAVATQAHALRILYEDAQLLAVDKPAGLPTLPGPSLPGATLADLIAARFPECARASADPREAGLGHRLDTGTSGVLVVARDRVTWTALRAILSGGSCTKRYLALVVGDPATALRPAAAEGLLWPAGEAGGQGEAGGPRFSVAVPIGRAGRSTSRMKLGKGRGVLEARTEVAVLERRGATTLVLATLARGRPHQVRAHLVALGCPIVGDEVYGAAAPGGLHLHAASVRFAHPASGAVLEISAPAPLWAVPA
jgi:23S rRNA pseudouridine1911/1915/1917 synthase